MDIRWKRPLVVGLVMIVIGGILALFRIVDIPHLLGLVAIIVSLDFLVAEGRGRAPEAWPAPPLRFRGGARSEVAQLAWATVDRKGNVSEKVLHRVRALARGILAMYGVNWVGEPGTPMVPGALALELLGVPAITALTTTGKVRPRALESAVTRLEKLAAEAPKEPIV